VWSRAKGPCDVPPSPCNRASSEGSRYVQVFLGSAPITLCPRLPPKRAGSQVPSLRRCYPASTVLRTCPTPDQAATSVSLGSLSPPARASPDNPCHLACVLCPLPRRSRTGALAGFLPRPTRPSPLPSRVGDRIATFEACSGFTRVTARMLAQPPARPSSQGSDPSGCPDKPPVSYSIKPATIEVDSSSTGDTRLQGALGKGAKRIDRNSHRRRCAFAHAFHSVRVGTARMLFSVSRCVREPRLAHPTPDARSQSLNGSTTSRPAITTPKGLSVCSIRIVPAWCARTSGRRR
jgi:hypothetical protein